MQFSMSTFPIAAGVNPAAATGEGPNDRPSPSVDAGPGLPVISFEQLILGEALAGPPAAESCAPAPDAATPAAPLVPGAPLLPDAPLLPGAPLAPGAADSLVRPRGVVPVRSFGSAEVAPVESSDPRISHGNVAGAVIQVEGPVGPGRLDCTERWRCGVTDFDADDEADSPIRERGDETLVPMTLPLSSLPDELPLPAAAAPGEPETRASLAAIENRPRPDIAGGAGREPLRPNARAPHAIGRGSAESYGQALSAPTCRTPGDLGVSAAGAESRPAGPGSRPADPADFSDPSAPASPAPLAWKPVPGERTARTVEADDGPAPLAAGDASPPARGAPPGERGMAPPAPAADEAAGVDVTSRRILAGEAGRRQGAIFADRRKSAGAAEPVARPAGVRSFLEPQPEPLAEVVAELGTGVAKRETVMSARHSSRISAVDSTWPAIGGSAVGGFEFPRVLAEPAAGESAPVVSAARAVDAVLNRIEHAATGDRAGFHLQFSVGGETLVVHVRWQADEVRTLFRTDSAELRQALTEQWQAVVPAGAERTLRLADPQFSSSTSPEAGDTTGERSGQRQDRPEPGAPFEDAAPPRSNGTVLHRPPSAAEPARLVETARHHSFRLHTTA